METHWIFTSHLHYTISETQVFRHSATITLKTLYLRSHSSYCLQIWCSFLIRDSKTLEQIYVDNYHLEYMSRLIHLNMLPLTLWRHLSLISYLRSKLHPIFLSLRSHFYTTHSSFTNKILLDHSHCLKTTRHF